MQIILTPEILLAAYQQGLFPMAERAESTTVQWYCPQMRGQLPIAGLHISASLKKRVLSGRIDGQKITIHVNRDFCRTIQSCAHKNERRPETWINQSIIEVFCELHALGHAHSVECWRGAEMIGGLYGIACGGAFFGESMFSTATDASKICLVHLVARLWHAQFEILDTQFTNPHLQQFGVYEIPYKTYLRQLCACIDKPRNFLEYNGEEPALVRHYLRERAES